jgi:cytoskeletal protein CcmA (bactofilin family)
MAHDEPGVIGRGITIRGSLSGSEPLVIEGIVEGTISLENHLTVEATGKLLADLEIQTVTVNGEVQGNITAQQMVSIKAGASVVGNIQAPRVVIEDGAVFKGSVEMDFELPEGVE